MSYVWIWFSLCCQVVLRFDLKGLNLSRIWSKFSSGQIATSTEFFHSRKFSTGGLSSSEIFYLCPLSIALSEQLFLRDQCRIWMLISHKIDVESLVHFCKWVAYVSILDVGSVLILSTPLIFLCNSIVNAALLTKHPSSDPLKSICEVANIINSHYSYNLVFNNKS